MYASPFYSCVVVGQLCVLSVQACAANCHWHDLLLSAAINIKKLLHVMSGATRLRGMLSWACIQKRQMWLTACASWTAVSMPPQIALGQFPEAAALFREALMDTPDDWTSLQQYLDCTLGSSTGNEDGAALAHQMAHLSLQDQQVLNLCSH